ncbi:hypothetical protein quinque_009907 [Culex quinquefasciatus]
MVNLRAQTVLFASFLVGCCILCRNSTNGIFVKNDEYDDSPTRAANENPQNFHEVDAFGDDYVDFGAHTGANGAFYWHANFPVEDHADYSDENK